MWKTGGRGLGLPPKPKHIEGGSKAKEGFRSLEERETPLDREIDECLTWRRRRHLS